MLLKEDYFNDLEIKDEHIIDDINDVEEPKHELTVEDAQKLHKQYDYCIVLDVRKHSNSDTTFFQTSLIPRLFKRLDTIFEFYGIIEHSEYVLTAEQHLEWCETVVKFGDYQLFCREKDKDEYINNTYKKLLIYVYVNYPKFNNYKRAFRFIYTMINLHRIARHINCIHFDPFADDYVTTLYFWFTPIDIRFQYFNRRSYEQANVINLCNELTEKYKRQFYKSIFCHFFGEKKIKNIDQRAIERDVPLKPIKKVYIR